MGSADVTNNTKTRHPQAPVGANVPSPLTPNLEQANLAASLKTTGTSGCCHAATMPTARLSGWRAEFPWKSARPGCRPQNDSFQGQI